jgi:hypothetical protein
MKYVNGKYFSREIAVKGRELEMQLARDFFTKGPTTSVDTQRDWQKRLEDLTFGKNTVIYDDLGNPSVMVKFTVKTLDELIPGAPTSPHPAFIVNGKMKPEIFISKYQNIVVGASGSERAISLPMTDPRASISFDNARQYCANKGTGWHLMTNAEWAAIALWCRKVGKMPRGNTSNGASSDAPYERGVKTTSGSYHRTLTSSGPASWNHDGTLDGIADLCGNVWEWVQGLKIIDSIAHVMIDNNFADPESAWVNTGVNITAGMTSGHRILTMREGAIPNTPSMDWSALAIPATTSSSGSADYGNDGYWFNVAGERLPIRGGDWQGVAAAGVFALNLNDPRWNLRSNVGFRSAFIP